MAKQSSSKTVFQLPTSASCLLLSLSAGAVHAATYPLAPDPNPNANLITIGSGDTAFNGAENGYFNFGAITVQAGGVLENQTTDIFVNQGLIELKAEVGVTPGGVFRLLNGGSYSQSGGSLLQVGGRVENSTSFSYTSTVTVNSGGGFRNLAGGSINAVAGSTMTLDGALENAANATFTLKGAMNSSFLGFITNGGVLDLQGGSLTAAGLINNTGTVNIDGAASLAILGNFITNGVAGQINSAGTVSIASFSVATNDGGISVSNGAQTNIDAGATLSGTGSFNQNGPLSTTIVNGTMDQAIVNIFEGELCGTGRVINPITYVGPTARVCPGLSPGTLTIEGDLALDGAYVAEIESSTVHDQLVVEGELNLGETSVLDLRFGPGAQLGDSVTILQVAFIQGGFAQTLIPDGYDAQVSDGGNGSLTVTVTGVPQVDADGDGVADSQDNCKQVVNPTQCDSDNDGYGNRCDGDLNNNGSTNAQDTTLYRQQLGQPSVGPTFNKADLNCNGNVNAQDTTLFRQLLGSPPGPSGLVP